ncbi:MAG TPA: hypothetical protein VD969_19530 [Symbiobacteriaceae bacterium]|nr:hypothetical protein [Symbiobacteriaceae bacterium]
MAMVTLNGVQLPNPSKIEVGKFNLTKAGRSASGLMTMEIIARKRSVTIQYTHLSEPDLKVILDQLDSRVFHTLTYPDPQGTAGTITLTVYAGDLAYKPWHRVDGVWWWQEISIPLIER